MRCVPPADSVSACAAACDAVAFPAASDTWRNGVWEPLVLPAMQVDAENRDLAYGDLVRLAVFRLQLERDLGTYLAQHAKFAC